MKDWHESQRGYFAGSLFDHMAKDDRIVVITGDLGFGMFDKIRDMYPNRFFNVGAAEQSMVGIAVGMALEGKIPFVYTIGSFYLRAAETISLYLAHEQVPVKLVGGGRDDDYKHDGYSHYAYEAQKYLEGLGIICSYPELKEDVPGAVNWALKNESPMFLSLRR